MHTDLRTGLKEGTSSLWLSGLALQREPERRPSFSLLGHAGGLFWLRLLRTLQTGSESQQQQLLQKEMPLAAVVQQQQLASPQKLVTEQLLLSLQNCRETAALSLCTVSEGTS